VVMNAGFWKHNFHQKLYAQKVVHSFVKNVGLFVWRTTTSQIGQFEFSNHTETDNLLCGFNGVVCMNTSWTKTLNASEYWNKNHFKEKVNNKLNAQLLSIIKNHHNKLSHKRIKTKQDTACGSKKQEYKYSIF
jgi:hypothetical protein